MNKCNIVQAIHQPNLKIYYTFTYTKTKISPHNFKKHGRTNLQFEIHETIVSTTTHGNQAFMKNFHQIKIFICFELQTITSVHISLPHNRHVD